MRRGSLLAPVLLLLLSGCSAPGAGGEGYVVIDAAARRAGLAVEVDGEALSGLLPVAVAPEALAVLAGPERREALAVAPGELVFVRGKGGTLERGTADPDQLGVRGSEGPVRALADRIGARAIPEGGDRFLLRGMDVLPIAALFEEPKGILATLPVYVGSAGEKTATEDEAALAAFLEANSEDNALGVGASLEEQRRERIEQDLGIQLSLSGRRVFEPGQPIPVRAMLVNRGLGRRWVVEPGDGSDMGWREPYVYFTARREQAPGVWVDVEVERYSRCGNFDHRWDQAVVALGPGGTLAIDRWLIAPDRGLELQIPGRVRLYAHYKYRAGKFDSTFQGSVAVPPELEGTPAFELVSAPLEIQIERPLDVVLSAKGQAAIQPGADLDSLFAITLSNRSGAAIPVPGPGEEMNVHFEVRSARLSWWQARRYSPLLGAGRGQALRPAQEIALSASGDVAEGEGAPGFRQPLKVQVRAEVSLWKYDDPRRREVKSNWVEATMESP